jgi:hypothetical protein
MKECIATDNDHVAVHVSFDDDVATQDDDGLGVYGIARQDGGCGRGSDDSMWRRQHFSESVSE